MFGGAWEYVAGYDASSSSSDISKYGSSFASKGGKSSKYATAYSNGTSEYSAASKLYKVSITGDAIKEVRQKSSSYGWFSDKSAFVGSDCPFFRRGGGYDTGSNAGVFCSSSTTGVNGGNTYSFRVVLCP
jgi:hypothetical protein